MKESAYLTNINKSSAPHSAGILSVFSHFNLPLRTLLFGLLMLLGSVGARGQQYYVFLYKNVDTYNFLANVNDNPTVDNVSNNFSYATCVWTFDSENRLSNAYTSSTRYLMYYNSNTYHYLPKNANVGTSNAYKWTIDNNTVRNNDQTTRYIRFTGTFWELTTTSSSRNVVYQISGPSTSSLSAPTITGTTTFSELNSYSYTGSNSTYTAPYYTLTGASTYYVQDGGTPQTNITSFTTTTGINYSWTLENSASYDDGYVRISGNSVEYYKSYGTETTLTLRAVATHTASSTVSTATSQTLTFMPLLDPTNLDITSGNTMTVNVGNTGNITYSLQPNSCYDNVTFSSNATGVATVSSDGIVTGVSAGTATITVTAHTIDENANLTKTVTVTVKDKVATPAITFTPDANDNTKATTTITCTTPGTTIYYKVNDGNYAEFSSDFEVNDGDDVSAYAVKTSDPDNLWDDSDETTDTYVSCTTDAPIISYVQSGSVATVTITAEADATIYYTTNGQDPTPGSTYGTTTVTIDNVASETTIKAFAKNSTCSASGTVEKLIIISGVTSEVVTLNDLEDHSWSYYSDASQPIHSLNPADIKITYYGNGEGTVTNADENGVTPTSFSLNATTVAVSGYESANQFVYYKTLENADAEGVGTNYPYTLIPNPFSKRPTVGTISTDAGATCWRGFYGWRVKKLGDGVTISDYSVGDIIPAEKEITFVTSNEYGSEVEFEAMWAQAWFAKAVNNTSILNANVSYERNFICVSGAITTTNSRPATIMELYPNGTTNGTTAATAAPSTSRNLTGYSLSADTKFEFIALSRNGNNNMTANNHYLCFGRGINASNNAAHVSGMGDASSAEVDYMIRLESGRYDEFGFIGNGNWTMSNTVLVKAILGCDYDRAKNDNAKLEVSRNNSMFYSTGGVDFSSYSNKDQKTFDCVVKSGTYQSQVTNDGAYNHSIYCGHNSASAANGQRHYPGARYITVEGGVMASLNGGRATDNAVNDENVTYTPSVVAFYARIKGGTFRGSVFGGAADNSSGGTRKIVITGGEIRGWVASGSNGTNSGSIKVGRTYGNGIVYVGGNAVIGGQNATSVNNTNGGQVFGAGRGTIANNYTDYMRGSFPQPASVYNSYVVIADNAEISNPGTTGIVGGNVYGGGNYGTLIESSNVYILGGTVQRNVYGGAYGNYETIPKSNVIVKGGTIGGSVYGGSNQGGKVVEANVIISGGTISGSAFGAGLGTQTTQGDYTYANEVDNTNVTVSGGNVNTDVYGGGEEGKTNGNSAVTVSGGIVGQDVYGGGALANVGTNSSNTTTVTITGGTVQRNVYGGGLGSNSVSALVNGKVAVAVYGGRVVENVFGCNNIKGAPQNTVTVDIYGTDPAPDANHYAIGAVYGGGNLADYDFGTPTVTVHNCDNSIGYVYGGGNAAHITNGNTDVTIYGGNKIGNVFGGGNGTVNPANVSGNTNVKIYGGTIGRVFGGSNSQGTIDGTISVNVAKGEVADTDPDGSPTACAMHIDEVYGGGNMAASNAGSITIGCTGDEGEGIGDVYGGANAANITGDILLNISGGSIQRVFGGNNTSGSVNGSITVNVNWNDALNCGKNYLGNVFGGGNQAIYTAPTGSKDYPAVNILKGTVSGDVFGGGYGNADDATKGVVTGNPHVTINGTGASVVGGVYGGGSLASTTGNPVVTLTNGSTTNIYGGGMAAGITGSPTVNINGGSVSQGVYGGCNTEGTVGGDITVNVTAGQVGTSTTHANIHGGGYGSATATSGNVDVNINGSSVVIYGDVYGGSALGNVNSDTNDYTHVTLTAGTIYGDVYGGGLGQLAAPAVGTEGSPGYVPAKEAIAALVKGNVKVTQNGVAFGKATTTDDESHTVVTAGRIFGCNNLNGSPKGTVLVLVSATAPVGGGSHTKGTYEMAAVYGGGNLAAYDPTNPNATGQYPDGSTRTNKPLQVVIDGCQEVSIEYVYGGGNAAPTPSTDVLILGAFEIGNAFGGGNGKDKYTLDGGTTWNANNGADVGYKGSDEYGTGKSELSLLGGTIHHAFGGSNTLGNVRDESIAYLDESDPTCPLNIDEVYGGGNEAPMDGSSQVNLGCISYLKEIYGGAKQANVGGDIVLTITSGRFERVFGGNNLGGTINGSITVNIEETGCHPIVIGELYGCGNQASYTTPDGKDDPTLNVKSFTSIGQIFGGGFGASATVKGNPVVNINVIKGEKNNGDVTAGTYNYDTDATEGHFDTNGNFKEWTVEFHDDTTEPAVVTSSVTVPAHSKGEIGAIGNVFGGGNAAKVDGNTEVNIGTEATVKYTSDAVSAEGRTVLGADIRYNIYGGGNQADVTGKTNVTIGPE